MNYGLPQNRERIYIIGRRASLYQLHVPRDPPVFARQVKPRELLGTQDNEPGHLTSLQSHCLAKMKDLYGKAMANADNLGCYTFVEAGARPHWADSLGRQFGACGPLPVPSSIWAIHPGV